MNIIEHFLTQTGMKQTELVELLREKVDPRFDQALVSKMKQGLVEPTAEVIKALSEACILPSETISDRDGVIYQEPSEKALRTENYWRLISLLTHSLVPLSRSYLAHKLGVTDRQLRRLKEQATRDGNIIGSSSHGKGYYLCRNRGQLLELKAEYRARINSLMDTYRAIQTALERLPGQEEMKL